MSLLEAVDQYNNSLEKQEKEVTRSLNRSLWQATQQVTEFREKEKIHPLCDPESGECGGCNTHTRRLSDLECSCIACHGDLAEKPRREALSSTVKARIVGGCLVITLPSLIRKESGIGEDDKVELRLDKGKDEITLSWSKGETE